MVTDLFREQVAGISIRDDLVTAAWARRGRGNRIEVRRLARAKLSRDADDPEIAGVIRGLWKESRMPTCSVCSCLQSRSLVLKHVQYDGLSPEEIESALRLDAELVLRLPPEEIVLDWQVTGRERGEKGSRTEGLLVAMPRDDIKRHLRILGRAGLYPVAVDVGSLAVANLCLALRAGSDPQAPVCVVDADASSADIVVLGSDGFIYPRSVFRQAGSWVDGGEYLAESLVEVLRYCRYHLGRPPVEKVLFTGSATHSAEIVDRLAAVSGLPVEPWDPFTDLPVVPSRLPRASRPLLGNGRELAHALGLALRGADRGSL